MYTQLCREMLEKKNMGEKLLNIHLINRIQSDKGLYNVSGVVLFFKKYTNIISKTVKTKLKCVETGKKNLIKMKTDLV